MGGLPKEIYVVVAERDYYINDKTKKGVPIAFESEHFDIESARAFQKRIGTRYGRTAIYKAEKVENENNS